MKLSEIKAKIQASPNDPEKIVRQVRETLKEEGYDFDYEDVKQFILKLMVQEAHK